jgi:hypothetical protein
VKVLKILGVVFGALLLLTGLGLLAGSAVAGAGQGALDKELAKQGLAGPVKGTVTSIDQATKLFTVNYTDKQGGAQTGTGPVLTSNKPPVVGDEVNVYYNTAEPSQIAIYDLPGAGNIGGIAKVLQTAAIVCLIVGALLLLVGIIGLVSGRKNRAAVTADQAAAPQPVPAGQSEAFPAQQYPAQQYPPQQYPPQQYPPQQYPPQPGPQDQSGQQLPPPGQQYPPAP